MLELLHTLLQIKFIPLGRDSEVFVLWPDSPPGQSPSHSTSAAVRDNGTLLNDTPTLGAECSVEGKAAFQISLAHLS